VTLVNRKILLFVLTFGALLVIGAAVRRVRHERQCEAGDLTVCARLCARGRHGGCDELDRRCRAGQAEACAARTW
jgi:hypothetical protein